MTRKIYLLVASCVAFAALSGLGGTAAFAADGIHDDCDGAPYNNDPVIHEFNIESTASHSAKKPSGINGGALACGTDTDIFGGGQDSLYKYVRLTIAPGVVVTPTSDSDLGKYVGHSSVDIIGHFLGVPSEYYNQQADVSVGTRGTGEERCPAEAIACYFGSGDVGWYWSWVLQDGDDLTMVVGPMQFIFGFDQGLARIEMNLCTNFGAVNGADCGNTSDPIQYNGDSSYPVGCVKGNGLNGLYSIIAVQRGGIVTPPAEDCVNWLSGLKDYKKFRRP